MLVDTGVPGAGSGVIETLEKNGWSPGDFRIHRYHARALGPLRGDGRPAGVGKTVGVLSHIYCGWVLSQRWTRFIVLDPVYGEPSRAENFSRFESSVGPDEDRPDHLE